MNVQSTAPIDPDAFLRWNEGREGKRELVNGRVVEMMTGATFGHARRVRQLARILEDRLDSAVFEVVTNDIAVKTRSAVRYPDIVVDRSGSDSQSLAARAPVLIVEVLSPSSIAIEMVEKAAEYTSIPSLKCYIVMAQHDPNVWVWMRRDGGWEGPTLVDGTTGIIEIPPLELAIPFKEFYPDFRTE